ncbi:nuclear receptor subfamily 5 group A member 2-like [Brachyistius frenatus]|uniref:nuclear receptor subfamily 5 group A member 2-like n=1 Tax=Brachyistius frenatus TaxID=100188 RepID=UPI0037E71454
MESKQDVGLDESCPVCGDKVSGYHYGLLTCESCKGFFKRTVQNKKKYTCVENQECRMDKALRKRCPFCRFQKCLHVGMRLEAVRADRMRGGRNKFGPMYKQDRALKQQRRAFTQADGRAPLQRDFSFPAGLQPAAHLPHSSSLSSDQPPALSSLQYHGTSSSAWTIKSEYSNICAGSSGSAAATFDPDDSDAVPSSDPAPSMPQLVMEFLRCDQDELQLQEKISARLQQEDQTKHWQPDTFGLMCAIADQVLLSIVEWARTSVFFKQLKVSDQMKLLYHCWSELLLLDFISRQVLYGKPGRLLMATGQQVELSHMVCGADPILAGLAQRGQQLVEQLHNLKVDCREFACIKFLVLFNPDVKELEDRAFVGSIQDQVEAALLEYTASTCPQYLSRITHLLLSVSELRSLSSLAEDYLHCTHLSVEAPCNNLLMEMLHAKCSRT